MEQEVLGLLEGWQRFGVIAGVSVDRGDSGYSSAAGGSGSRPPVWSSHVTDATRDTARARPWKRTRLRSTGILFVSCSGCQSETALIYRSLHSHLRNHSLCTPHIPAQRLAAACLTPSESAHVACSLQRRFTAADRLLLSALSHAAHPAHTLWALPNRPPPTSPPHTTRRRTAPLRRRPAFTALCAATYLDSPAVLAGIPRPGAPDTQGCEVGRVATCGEARMSGKLPCH